MIHEDDLGEFTLRFNTNFIKKRLGGIPLFYVSRANDTNIWVMDTNDWVEECYTHNQIRGISDKVGIVGVRNGVVTKTFSLRQILDYTRTLAKMSGARVSNFDSVNTLIDESGLVFGWETIPNGVKDISLLRVEENVVGRRKVIVPDGVGLLTSSAFRSCQTQSVYLPDSVWSINQRSFYKCKLRSIRFPKFSKYFYIGEKCFYQCTHLKEVALPVGTKEIPLECFEECSALEKVVIPPTVVVIGCFAFSHCYKLRDIEFGGDLKKISNNAFCGCESLRHVTFNDGLFNIGACAFEGCANLKSITLSPTIDTIDGGAFDICEKLTEINALSASENIKISRSAFGVFTKHLTFLCRRSNKTILSYVASIGATAKIVD